MGKAHQVEILDPHLGFVADKIRGKLRRFKLQIINLFNRWCNKLFCQITGERRCYVAVEVVDLIQQRIYLGKHLGRGERKGVNGAFHPLKQVNANEVDQALFSVNLLEYPFAALEFMIITASVFGLFVDTHVFHGRVKSQ